MDTDDEEKLLRSVALQNVQSILQARQRAEQELLETKEALEEETRILELLNEAGARLAAQLDLESVAQAATDAGTQLSGAQFGAFFYKESNAEGDIFRLFTVSGAPREAFENLGHPRATPVLAPTFRGEGVIRVGDVTKDPRYGQTAPPHGIPGGHLPIHSYLAIPVTARSGEVMGGLFFGHGDPDVFSARSERLVVGIAAQAAVAIDNARLYEEVKRSAEERARLLEAERAARAESERMNLMKDEFLATLSHELRTPLNAMLGWSQILLSRAEENSEAHRGLEIIARNALAQAKLIDDLLDMNRILSGKIRIEVQRIELSLIVEAALESVAPSADAKRIVVRKTLDPNPGVMFGDPNRLQQVVWNLLTNAVKFTPKDGRIDVLVERVDAHVEITVRDTGIGMSAEFLPHLFERFRQADSSTTRKYGGLGLGLSIAKQLVELHGGSIRAESAGEGKGATFVVSLPLRETTQASREHPSDERHRAARAPEISLSGIKVLVVEDEPDAREIVKAVLIRANATVLTASSAEQGLALIQSQRPDVIISDIGMPERDGYQLMRDVRSLPPEAGGNTPAIALTAFARSSDRTRAVLAGYQVHLPKPIDPQELVATIKSLADHAER